MLDQYLHAGQIVNTHGVRGEIRILPWADAPAFLCKFKTFFVDGAAYPILRARVHKNMVIATLDGVDTMEKAEALKGKELYILREEAHLPEGRFFVQDLLGMTAVEDESGRILGKITDIIDMPVGSVLEITGEKNLLVPAVGEFIRKFSPEEETVRLHIIEGMEA